MENRAIDGILEDLFRIFPVIHKKLSRIVLGGLTGELSRLHLAIMWILTGERLPVSEIARRLAIPKPQMTHLLDQLAELGIIARHLDAKDRRVVNISLTDHGRTVLKKCREQVKQNIKNKLSCLSSEELAELSVALEKLKDIGAKLE